MAISWVCRSLVLRLLLATAAAILPASVQAFEFRDEKAAVPKINPVFPEERYIEEEDVILTRWQEAALFSGGESRKASADLAVYWPDSGGFPRVPYTFTDGYVNREAVWDAIAHWEENTCLIFEEVPTTYSGPHLAFERNSENCSSYVGMTGSSAQSVYLTELCEEHFGELVIEIGHAIGMWHEETRSDRDTYVHINTDNALPEKLSNFFKESDNSYGVPYDYSSIMHNHERVFALNGHITIATLNPLYQGLLGQQNGLSHMDKLLANKMYGCSAKLIASSQCSSDTCLNNGYLSTTCTCVCPDGTSGTNCETVTTPYNDAILSPYTELINTEGTITSPNHPSYYQSGLKFTKWIQAPECNNVVATFTAFDVYWRTDHYIRESETASMCWYDGLEIRTDNMLDGTWYCGQEISSGDSFTSTGNQMVIYFKTATTNFKTGWSADITFVEDPRCTSTTSSTTTPGTSTTTTASTTSTTPTTTSTSTSTTPTTTSTSTTPTTTSTSTTSTSTSSTTTSTSTSPTTTSTSTTSTTPTTTSTSTTPTTTSTSTTSTTPTTTSTSTTSTTSTSTTSTTPTTTSTSTTSTSTSTSTTPTTTSTSTTSTTPTTTSTSTTPTTTTSTTSTTPTTTSTSTSSTTTSSSSTSTTPTTTSTSTTPTTTSTSTTPTTTSTSTTSTTPTTTSTTTSSSSTSTTPTTTSTSTTPTTTSTSTTSATTSTTSTTPTTSTSTTSTTPTTTSSTTSTSTSSTTPTTTLTTSTTPTTTSSTTSTSTTSTTRTTTSSTSSTSTSSTTSTSTTPTTTSTTPTTTSSTTSTSTTSTTPTTTSSTTSTSTTSTTPTTTSSTSSTSTSSTTPTTTSTSTTPTTTSSTTSTSTTPTTTSTSTTPTTTSTSTTSTTTSTSTTSTTPTTTSTSTTSTSPTTTSTTSTTPTSTSTSTTSTTPTTTSTSTTSTSTSTTPTTTSTSTTSTTPTTTSTSTTSTTTSTSTTSTTPTTSSTSTTSTTPTTTSTSTTSTTPTTTSTSTTSTTPTTTSTSTTSTTPTTTSTSTTSTTSTSTTTSTSSTTTSTSSTTTSTKAITTTTPMPNCNIYTSGGYYFFESPRYPANYPNNAQCTMGAFTGSIVDTSLYINRFSLGSGDSVTIYNQYTPPLTLTGYIASRTTYRILGSNIQTTFAADSSGTSYGFSLRYSKASSPCGKRIWVSSDYLLRSPRFPDKHPPNKFCEYHFSTQSGYRLRVRFEKMKLPCSANYLAFNRDPDGITPFYNSRYNKIHCGYRNPSAFNAISNKLNVYFYGKLRSYGYKIRIIKIR